MTAPFAQDGSQQPFRSGLDVVQLDVLVLDQDRRPVRGLTEHDFTILEGGQIRPVVGFAPIELARPGSANNSAAVLESARGVVTNEDADPGRLVVIVFDRSIPVGPATEVAKAIGRSVVDALGPRDLAAVVRTSGFSNEGKSQNLTRDRRWLREAIDSQFTGFVNPPTMTFGGLSVGRPDLQSTGDCVCGLCTLESLHRIAGALTSAGRHQKVIVLIASDVVVSDGSATTEQCRGRVKVVREETLRALDRANVTVHSIDPSGLEALTSGVGAVERRFSSVRQLLQARQANLAVLPSYTGGRVVRDTNAPGDIVPKILSETTSYYLLGFERAKGGSGAGARPVKVRVNRPGVTVVARKAYYAAVPGARSTAADPLDDTISGVLPLRDIPMALSLASIITPAGDVKTNLVIGLIDRSVAATNGIASGAENQLAGTHLDLVLGVFDQRANQVSVGRSKFEPRTGGCIDGWCETVSQLTLKPGRYEVRAGVLDRKSSKKGSVYGYLEVPTSGADAFLASDLQIGAARFPEGTRQPTLRRTFRTEERITFLTQIQRPVASTAPVTVRASVSDSHAKTVVQNSSTLENASFSAWGVSEVRVDQSLSKLSPGTYMFTIEAGHLDRAVRRTVSFEVR